MSTLRNLSIVIMLIGVIGIVLGTVFVGLGMARDFELKEAMRVEHVSLGTEGTETEGGVIDSLGEAMERRYKFLNGE